MSNYIFAPSPTFGVSEHAFVTYKEGFTAEEIDKLCNHLEDLKKNIGVTGGNGENEGVENSKIRKSKVAWLSLNDSSQWVYDRMAFIARQLNGQFYKFDLYGFFEDMQYTVYDSSEGGHYTWHQDSGVSASLTPRKFSMVLQLSDPSEYEGGDLEILNSSEPQVVLKQKGLVAAFPSYTLHRVTPVTSGIRRTLVVWVCGPAFK